VRSLICVGSATKLRPSIPTENPPPAMLVASHHRNDSYLSGGQRLIRRVRKISPTQSVQVQQMAPNSSIQTSSNYHQAPVKKGRTQCRELPHCAGSEGKKIGNTFLAQFTLTFCLGCYNSTCKSPTSLYEALVVILL